MGPDEVREDEPNGDHFLVRDVKRPLSPRRRDATCSFQVAELRSILGMTDCVTSSLTKVRTAVASDSNKQGVGSSMSSDDSTCRLALVSDPYC